MVQRCIVVVVLVSVFACGVRAEGGETVMNAADALELPRPEADHRLSYGDDPLNFGELRLPAGDGPFPVVIVIHGGCWLAEYDLAYMSAWADAVTDAGVATWSIEYRRVGDPGGGWPGTFEDVARAADHLSDIAQTYDLDLERVAAAGHSAGGHLALWLAGRYGLDPEDPLRGDRPLALNGVVALAGITDLAAYAAPDGCGAAVPSLLGGQPEDVPERTRRASPIGMLPVGVELTMVTGALDSIVPAEQAQRFAETARRMGDTVEIIDIGGAGHFELVDPTHDAFGVIRDAVLKAVEPK